MYLLDKFNNKYIIKGVLRAEAPIHIGTGEMDFSPTAVDNSVIKDEYGKPFIPGTSLKGVLRCFMERIFNSEIFEEYKSCNVFDRKSEMKKKQCISDEEVEIIKQKYKDDSRKEEKIAIDIYKKQCDVCKLFGGHHFSSKINISDATLMADKVHIYQRDGVAIDRDTLTAADKKKYTFESVAAGTEFKFEMIIDNIEEEQINILKIMLNFLQEGEMKVGGKTSAGLGNVRLISKSIYLINRDNMREYFVNGINDSNKGTLEVNL